MNIIFILGSSHCGSTLLDLILDSHSQIIGVGEIDNYNKKLSCTCDKEFNDCSIWADIIKDFDLESLNIKKINFFFNRNKYEIKQREKWKKIGDIKGYLENNRKIYRKLLQKTNSTVVVDSSKNPNRVELLGKNKNIEPMIIHLVRDGKAVSWSYIKKYKKALPYMWEWFVSNLKVEILKRRNKFNHVFVRYEDLVRKPEETIKKILSKIELEYEPKILNFRNFTHHEIGGNRMRLKKDSEIKEDIEWKQKMPKKYKILFNLLFGWLNFYYKNR